MKLNYFTKQVSAVGRLIATVLLCVTTIAFVWQGTAFSVMAAPGSTLIAADLGNQVQGKASKDAGRAKGFIRDTADKVENMADKNANRVDDAADSGSYVERKAQRDAGRVHERAEQDAARTQKAVDNTKNAVERTVENIKDAFN